MKIENSIKRNIAYLFNCFKWSKQYKAIVSGPRKTNFVQNNEWYNKSRILMMVPHADDELISSYSVLCNAEDVTVYYCGFTGSNNKEENRTTRRKEILALCSELNVQIIEGDANCMNLREVISQGKFDTILIPSIVDWHAEHRRISYLINNVCASLHLKPRIYTYSVTVPNESHKEVICIPLSADQLQKKYNLFKRIYLSQKVMPIVRLKLNEKINGYHAGCYAAEVFSKYEFDKWTVNITRVELFERKDNTQQKELIDDLRRNLNNLVLVRQSSKAFYNCIENEDKEYGNINCFNSMCV